MTTELLYAILGFVVGIALASSIFLVYHVIGAQEKRTRAKERALRQAALEDAEHSLLEKSRKLREYSRQVRLSTEQEHPQIGASLLVSHNDTH